jgi:P27 family predicted phage terminase small subunit
MGRRGPIPQSATLKLLRGNPGRRKVTKAEPVVPLGTPDPPTFLSPTERHEWDRIVPVLLAAGLVTALDRAAVSLYCVAWARWIDAEAHLRQFGTLVRKPRGGQGASPYLRVANTAYGQMRALANELGLSPASRSRIHVTPPTPESEVDAFKRRHDHSTGAAKRYQKLQSSPPPSSGEDA